MLWFEVPNINITVYKNGTPSTVPVRFYVNTVTNIQDTLSKSVATVPIVSLPTDCAFVLESTTQQTYSFSFTRCMPRNVKEIPELDSEGRIVDIDVRRWSNGHWMKGMISLINRWQAKTDGCTMYFNCGIKTDEHGDPVKGANGNLVVDHPINDRYPYVNENVYIKSISFGAYEGTPDVISGSISVIVGGQLSWKISNTES